MVVVCAGSDRVVGICGLMQKMSTNYISGRTSAIWFLLSFVPVAALIVLYDPLPRRDFGSKRGFLAAAVGFTLALGNLTILLAFSSGGNASIIAPLAGLYPLVSIPIAIVALGETIGWRESLGIVCALAAVVMLSMQSEPQTAEHIHVRNGYLPMKTIGELLEQGPVIGDGGYLIELERRGWVDSGSGREQVGTGRGSGQFTPEVAIEHPEALRELHREFLSAGSQVLQALTFFGTREKLSRAGYGAQTEEINFAAVKLAKEVAGDRALVAGSVSRTQLVEREGMGALATARDHIAEQIRLLKDAGVDFLILETFFHLAEMKVALEAAVESGLVDGGHDEFPTVGDAVQRRAHPRRMRAGNGRSWRGGGGGQLRARSQAGCSRSCARCVTRQTWPSRPSRARSGRPTSAIRSRGFRNSRTHWRRSKSHGGSLPNSAASRRGKAFAMSAAVVGATPRTSVRLPTVSRQRHEVHMLDHTQMRCAIGIDVGGTKCAAGLISLDDGCVVARGLRPTRPERGGEAVLAEVVELAQSLQAEAKRLGIHPTSIGVGLCELVGRRRTNT